MVQVATLEAPLRGVARDREMVRALSPSVAVTTTHRMAEVEAAWRAFTFAGVESPGQSYDFVRLWTEALEIPERDQLYVLAALEGRPVALLPLYRRRKAGIRLYSWFPGRHVGCNAPLVDAARLAELSSAERTALWSRMTGAINGADLIYLPAVPATGNGTAGPFAELGRSLPVDTLYRSVFASWDAANATQRTKSRRKHDRQQGEKLEALGAVTFEEVPGGAAARPVLDVMFRQRARRFEAMGITDPFAPCEIARFYNATVAPDSGVEVKLHVLRLAGEIVAVRYNIVAGERLFCLISSMSDDPAIQCGSPGKQCLLRVMQTVFDAGFRVFDMGAGLTDEKRHWCNEQIPLANHYLPLTPAGQAIVAGHALWQGARTRIKANQKLLKLAKEARAMLGKKRIANSE
jgi:CelD/BcsL family acetyltransferase involved in cellulose biosynthesis